MSVTIHPPGEMPQQPGQPASSAQAPKAESAAASARPRHEMMYAVDSQGRRIGWKRLNALEDFDLTEIAGANSSNQDWMIRATIAFGVREIDGEVVPRPLNKNMLRAMIARLEEDGIQAILGMFNAMAEQEGGDVATAKNSPATPAIA